MSRLTNNFYSAVNFIDFFGHVKLVFFHTRALEGCWSPTGVSSGLSLRHTSRRMFGPPAVQVSASQLKKLGKYPGIFSNLVKKVDRSFGSRVYFLRFEKYLFVSSTENSSRPYRQMLCKVANYFLCKRTNTFQSEENTLQAGSQYNEPEYNAQRICKGMLMLRVLSAFMHR